MKRLCVFFGLVLFVAGVLVVPAFHNLHLAHCATSGQTESHNPETCAICVVAAIALVAACVHIAVVAVQHLATVVQLSDLLVFDMFIPHSHLARAPPVL